MTYKTSNTKCNVLTQCSLYFAAYATTHHQTSTTAAHSSLLSPLSQYHQLRIRHDICGIAYPTGYPQKGPLSASCEKSEPCPSQTQDTNTAASNCRISIRIVQIFFFYKEGYCSSLTRNIIKITSAEKNPNNGKMRFN